jgi:hypothetical protein
MTEKNFKTMVLSLLILTFFLTISPNAAAEKAAFFEALSREIDNNSNSYTNSFSEQSVYDGSRANLNFKREFLSGAEISQRAILDDQGRENYNFSFSYPLLPGTNSELENQYFELKKEIILAEAEYLKLKDQIIIELSSDYLNLLNQKKEVENLSRTKNDAALALKRAGRK